MSFKATKSTLGPKKKALERMPVSVGEESKQLQDLEEILDDESQESVFVHKDMFEGAIDDLRKKISDMLEEASKQQAEASRQQAEAQAEASRQQAAALEVVFQSLQGMV